MFAHLWNSAPSLPSVLKYDDMDLLFSMRVLPLLASERALRDGAAFESSHLHMAELLIFPQVQITQGLEILRFSSEADQKKSPNNLLANLSK